MLFRFLCSCLGLCSLAVILGLNIQVEEIPSVFWHPKTNISICCALPVTRNGKHSVVSKGLFMSQCALTEEQTSHHLFLLRRLVLFWCPLANYLSCRESRVFMREGLKRKWFKLSWHRYYASKSNESCSHPVLLVVLKGCTIERKTVNFLPWIGSNDLGTGKRNVGCKVCGY